MYSIKDGTLGRQGIIQAVDIDPHAHFRHAANERHGITS
jgi:hypothetical protein